MPNKQKVSVEEKIKNVRAYQAGEIGLSEVRQHQVYHHYQRRMKEKASRSTKLNRMKNCHDVFEMNTPWQSDSLIFS